MYRICHIANHRQIARYLIFFATLRWQPVPLHTNASQGYLNRDLFCRRSPDASSWTNNVDIGPLAGGSATTTILRKQRCIKAQLEHVSDRYVECRTLPDLEILRVDKPTVCEDVKLYLGIRYRIVTQADRSLQEGILAT